MTFLLALIGCEKVPIFDVNAAFTLADVSWFEEEQTAFVFYDVGADQGIGDPSVIEITYATDDERVDWTPLEDLPAVHTHVPVDCGVKRMCGSWSFAVEKEPRDVHLRLRYHEDGSLALRADTVFNVVRAGDPWSNRSYIVYGVLDEDNVRVQWRGRNVFPTIRNEQASEYGLRRDMSIADVVYGTESFITTDNPYGYGATCPDDFVDAGLSTVETDERAVFAAEDLPLDASDDPVLCAQATVTDATGTFTTGAIAQKNPEVRPAFPELRSPIHDATVLPFFLEPCTRVISAEHEAMQRQRLQMEDVRSTCTEGWDQEAWKDDLVIAFTDAIEAARPDGNDMVLVVGLNQDEDGLSEVVEQALAEVVPDERLQPSPRVVGSFLFDSDGDGLTVDALEKSTLWCPTTIELTDTDLPSAANLTCAIAPDNPEIELGPFSFSTLPILPTRELYLDFIATYSEAQAGSVTSLKYRTPEFATTADHNDIGDYGVATFLNGELISADPSDAFSWCTTDSTTVFVFRSETLQSDTFQAALAAACAKGTISADMCTFATEGLLPLQFLPTWHQNFPETSYDLGLGWDFPFLLQMEYETSAAGAVTAFGFSVPFGFAKSGESYLASQMWTTDTFSLEKELTQCTRFCDHPTFDSAGVYQVQAQFRTTYADACYVPDYPAVGDSGFPSDP